MCGQYSSNLQSITYFDDRIHVIFISNDGIRVDYICYRCRNKIDKELKRGKKPAEIKGNGLIMLGHGLNKILDKIQKELSLNIQIIKKSLDFFNYEYSKSVEIQSDDRLKYQLASLILFLSKEIKHMELEKHIKK